jgi:hypothetical protein
MLRRATAEGRRGRIVIVELKQRRLLSWRRTHRRQAMSKFLTAAALPALALLAGACQVNVDNQSKADIENSADRIGETIGNAADAIGEAADKAGDKIDNAADDIGNVDVDVDLHRNSDGNAAADGNSH